MKAEIIGIGDEILIGQVVDTNAVWISQHLNSLGVRVVEMVTVADEAGQIISTLDRYVGKIELIIMTGGLGPTKDDITKETLASYFDSKMVVHPQVLDRIRLYFKERGRTLIESNLRQADVPEKCRVLMNHQGSAPGMWFEKDSTILISLPGVPYEMKGIMQDHVFPEIQSRVEVPYIVHKTIMTQGVPESYLAATIRHWEAELPDCIKLAYLPRPGIVRLRLTAVDKCAIDAEQLLKINIDKLLNIIPQHIFGYDDISLEESLGLLLKERNLTLATAESCTGGNIARLITSIPGSSAYYAGSVVAYNNQIKTDVLGVDKGIIEERGAVSQEVVEQMALGIMNLYGTECAIATSGIAGPDGGTMEKPVGTIWVCVAYGSKIHAKKFRFSGSRDRIIDQTSYSGMQLLRRLILDML